MVECYEFQNWTTQQFWNSIKFSWTFSKFFELFKGDLLLYSGKFLKFVEESVNLLKFDIFGEFQ